MQLLPWACTRFVMSRFKQGWCCAAQTALALRCAAVTTGPAHMHHPSALPTCRELAGNSFSGTIPASWAQLPNLDKVVLQPGNPRLCPQPPQGATFSLCGVSPLCSPTDLNTTSCAAYAVTPSSGGGGGGGSSFPVAAVAVPVAVVVALAAAAGVILWMRRRKQRRQQQQQEGKEQQQQIENGVDEEREFPWVDVSAPACGWAACCCSSAAAAAAQACCRCPVWPEYGTCHGTSAACYTAALLFNLWLAASHPLR